MSEQQNTTKRAYRKEMGTFSATMLSVGAILGPAIAYTPVSVLGLGGPSGMLAWAVALILIFPVALCYAELGAMWPRAGGHAYYPLESNGPLVGIMNGWGAFFAYTLSVPSIMLALIEYISFFYKPLFDFNTGFLTNLGLIVALLAMLAIFVINNFRIIWLGRINNYLTIFATGIIAVFVIALFFHFSPVAFNSVHLGGFAPLGAVGFFAAITATIYGYAGFTHPVNYAEELKNPGRSIPRAIILSLIIVFFIYILESAAFLGSVTWSAEGLSVGNWAGLYTLPAPFVQALYGYKLAIIAILALVATLIDTFKDGVLFFGGGSRIGHNMARDGRYFPGFLKHMSKNGIPITTNVLVLIIGVVFILLMRSFASLILLVADGFMVSYMLGTLSVQILRKVYPNEKRPYKIPIVSVLGPFSFVVSSLLIYWSGWNAVWIIIAAWFIGLLFLISYNRVQKIHANDFKYGIWLPIFLISLLVESYYSQFVNIFVGTGMFVVTAIVFYYLGYFSGIAYHRHRGPHAGRAAPFVEDSELSAAE
ncbi:MAG: APC family permease [Thermoplasmatales archaeon]|nr:APC family permease [Candidatus Thermoplasmatota archaeon]MDA8054366.1 APC family permease [Thermoplasmatales archaeon]